MKLHSLFLATSFVVTSLACGGMGSSMPGVSSAAVAEPWASMSLPINDGTVVFSEPTSMTVTYSSGSVTDIAAGYETAIKAAGWSETYRDASGGSVTVIYSKDGSNLTLAALESLGTPMVSLSKT